MTIEKGNVYDGYLWYSDKQEPELYIGRALEQDISSGQEPAIPFVVEGFLCSATKSYSIKMVDGRYHITAYDIPEGGYKPSDTCTIVEYLPNRFPGTIQKLRFARLWEKETDGLCDMEVLVPQEEIFLGFICNREEEQS